MAAKNLVCCPIAKPNFIAPTIANMAGAIANNAREDVAGSWLEISSQASNKKGIITDTQYKAILAPSPK